MTKEQVNLIEALIEAKIALTTISSYVAMQDEYKTERNVTLLVEGQSTIESIKARLLKA